MSSHLDLKLAKPESVGMSSQRLQRIAPVIQSYIDQKKIPGAVTLVARQGRVVHFDSYGFKQIDNQETMQTDTLFRIASLTKPIVSLALMMLYEEGKFQLHDPIEKFLPVFANMTVRKKNEKGEEEIAPARRKINIRHLLTHTAGFAGEYRERNTAEYMRIVDPLNRNGVLDDFVNRLAKCPLNFEPGAEWDYSRATCVVGRLVEVLSGQTIKDFVQERILDPLGMSDTHFFVPPEKLNRFSASYSPNAEGTIELSDPNTTESFFASQDSQFYLASGGLVSTVSDYFSFVEMLRNGGVVQFGQEKGQRIVSRKTIELMLQNHIGNKKVWIMGQGYGFGLGLTQLLDAGAAHTIVSPGTYSWFGIFCTHWWYDPVEQLQGMVWSQLRPSEHLNIRHDMQVLATQAIDD